jgi:hypothetical protein
MDFKEQCYQLREQVKPLAKAVLDLRFGPLVLAGALLVESDPGEMIANLMLAYRHLEDAAMRLGKAVQAYDGGTSVYPR